MDLWSAIFTVVRRWYISVPVVVVSVVAMLVIGTRMKPDYQSKASVVFNPPARTVINGQDQAFKNQWASDPKTLAAAVYRQLKSTDEQKRLKDQNYSTRYEIALDQFSALMDISATGKSQDEAINTASQLIKEAEQTAKNIQKQSQPPANEYVTVSTVSQPVDAELVPGSKTRVMATILLLGLVGAASAAFMVESLANRRRLMREGGGVPPVPPLPQHYPYPPYPAAPYPALPPGGYVPAGPAPPGYGYVPVIPMAPPADEVDPDLVTMRAGAQASPQASPRNLSRRAESDERALDSLLDEVAVEEQEAATRPSRASDAHVINRGRGARAEQTADSAAGRSTARSGEEDALEIAEPAAPAAEQDAPAEAAELDEVNEHGEVNEPAEVNEFDESDEFAEVDEFGEFDESQGLVEAPAHVAATEQSLRADAPPSSAASADVAEGFEALGDIDDEARVSYASDKDADRGRAANEVVVLGPATTAEAATAAPAAQTHVAPDADADDTPDTEVAEEGASTDSPESATPAVEEVAEPSTPAERLEPSGQGQAASAGAKGRGTDGSGRSAERRREADRNKAGRNSGGRDGTDRKATTRNGGNSRSSARRARRSLFSPPTGAGSADAGDDVVPPLTSDTPTPHGD